MFAVALARALAVPLSADISWQLQIAQVLVDGGRLGRDVIEVNPPLAAWLEVPVILVAQRTGLPGSLVHEIAVALLGVASVMLVAQAARHVRVLSAPGAHAGFCLAAAVSLALQSGLEVGQREQLAILLVLPWFVLLAARLERAVVHGGTAVAVGLAAGVGFAMKPFFLLPLVAGEWVLLREWRAAGTVVRPETWCVAAALVLYALAVVLLAPDWFASAREFWPLYSAYRPATLYDVATRQGVVLLLAATGLGAWAVSRRAVAGASRLGDSLAVGLAGFLVAMLAQRKPWIYLAVPSGVLALLLLLAVVLETSNRMRTRAGRLLRAALVLAVALRMLRYLWWVVHPPTVSMADRLLIADYATLRAALGSLPHGTTMAALSPTHGTVFPLVPDVGGRWVMRLPSLWPALSGRAQSPEAQHRLRRLVAEDLARTRPEVLIVLDPGERHAWLGPLARRDWLAWLTQDAEGAAAVAPYREWWSMGEYRIFRRQATDGT